ncbi:MAG: phage terminase large subunit [Planctomycetia bacterium]|nr:phage terminase large subunit [Planctomycetia bacterium]
METPSDTRAYLHFIRKLRAPLAMFHGESRRQNARVNTDADSFESWCFRFLPAHFTRTPSFMHRWMFRYLDKLTARRGEKLNLLAPRGGAKSTIGTLAFPLKCALERSESYIWIVSDTHDQAKMHLENIRQALIDNSELRRAYPNSAGRGIRYRDGVLTLANGVRLEAFGTGQKLRGRRHAENRPNLIICDDLQNDSHSRSTKQRTKSREWFFGTLLKGGNSRTNIIHLATALHRDALAMELTRTPGWKSRIFRSIVRYPEKMGLWEEWESILFSQKSNAMRDARRFYESHREEMNLGAKVLWEAEEDLYTLMKMRAEAGHSAFEREKQNSPINPDLCEFDEKYFERDSLFIENFPPCETRVIALDPSKGKHAAKGDYSAFVMLGMDKDGDLFVDARLERLPIDVMVETGIELWRKFQPHVFGIEGNQFQDLLSSVFAQKTRESGIKLFEPALIYNHTSKIVRLRRLEPYLASGRMHFKTNSPGARLLVEQIRQFPIGDHDDGPDALEMALRILQQISNVKQHDDGLGDNIFGSFGIA